MSSQSLTLAMTSMKDTMNHSRFMWILTARLNRVQNSIDLSRNSVKDFQFSVSFWWDFMHAFDNRCSPKKTNKRTQANSNNQKQIINSKCSFSRASTLYGNHFASLEASEFISHFTGYQHHNHIWFVVCCVLMSMIVGSYIFCFYSMYIFIAFRQIFRQNEMNEKESRGKH